MSNKMSHKLLLFILGCLFLATGICLGNNANLGIAVYDAMVFNFAEYTNLSYGFINTLVGLLFVGIQIIITRKWNISYVIQMLILLAFSSIADFLMYFIFKNLIPTTLMFQIIFFIFSNIFCCLGVALVLNSQLQSFPIETSMNIIYEYYHFKMSAIKYTYDAIYLILAILIGVVGTLSDWHLGLGTIIMFIIQGWLINYFFEKIKAKINKQ